MKRAWALLGLLMTMGTPAISQQTGFWGDQGDGTFRNPIIAGDYSDPDVIRVGSDYYLVSSTFESSPGVAVLHSKDLVNWRSIGGAIKDVSQIGPAFTLEQMNRFGGGVYAPSIRYHDGKFWVFVNSFSGEGFWVSTATSPAGPWTITQIRDKNGRPLRTNGWTDPCPFWDDDGKAYLASSRPSSKWFSYLFQMTPDGTQLLDAEVEHMKQNGVIYEYPNGGTLFSPFHSSEGNKIYKRNGYYYLLHIEFTNAGQGAGTYIFRSKYIYGTKADGTPGKPGDAGKYEVLKLGGKLPGQGSLVDTPDGRWFWIAQFNRMGSDGRNPNLLPVTWIDNWPVVGVDIKDKVGDMVWQMQKPIQGEPISYPQGSDEFNKPTLDAQWTWMYQPRDDKWSLTERPGFLRMHAFQPREAKRFFKIGNVLHLRYLRSEQTTETIKLELGGMADGQEAGIARFNGGKNYASLAIVQKDGTKTLKYEEDSKATAGPPLDTTVQTIWLRSVVGFDEVNAFQYSTDGQNFVPIGGAYKVRQSGYRSDRVGIYTFNPNAEAGYLDVDFFHRDIKNK